MVSAAHWLVLGGLACLALALISYVLFGGAAAALATGCMAGVLLFLWYGLPLRDRLRHKGSARTGDSG